MAILEQFKPNQEVTFFDPSDDGKPLFCRTIKWQRHLMQMKKEKLHLAIAEKLASTHPRLSIAILGDVSTRKPKNRDLSIQHSIMNADYAQNKLDMELAHEIEVLKITSQSPSITPSHIASIRSSRETLGDGIAMMGNERRIKELEQDREGLRQETTKLINAVSGVGVIDRVEALCPICNTRRWFVRGKCMACGHVL